MGLGEAKVKHGLNQGWRRERNVQIAHKETISDQNRQRLELLP